MQLQQAALLHDPPSDLRADSMESISSTKMTAGCMQPATAKSARTIFSPCPIHLLVSEDALMLKKVAWILLAMALPIRVLPVPGGPNRSSPLAGALAPCKLYMEILLMMMMMMRDSQRKRCIGWPSRLERQGAAVRATRCSPYS